MFMQNKKYWENIDLITIGTFAALIKVSGYLITICGGGMNPIAFILKNIMITALTIVLCYKVRKFGTLSLYLIITFLFGLIITGGGGHVSFPMLLLGAFLSDGIIMLFGGYKKSFALMSGVIFFDTFSRFIGFIMLYFTARENVMLMIMPMIIVTIGYLGCLLGLPTGLLLLKELRHAGIVRK
jgi:energy-coupling factor transport system substrate-specific component